MRSWLNSTVPGPRKSVDFRPGNAGILPASAAGGVRIRIALVALAALSTVASAPSAAAQDDSPSYYRDVWPVIQQRCQGCHQPAQLGGELNLTSFEGLAAGGMNGPALVAGKPKQSRMLKMLRGEIEPAMPMRSEPLAEAAIAAISDWIAAGAADDTPDEVRLDVATGPIVYRQPPVITAVAYSADGEWLAVSGNREVLLHRRSKVGSGDSLEARFSSVSERIQGLAFLKNGRLVATGGTPARFGEIQIWDVDDRKLRVSTTVCYDTLFGLAISPDERRLAIGCADNTVRIHQATSGRELLRMNHHENWVLGVVFGGDGRRIVSVGRDRAAKLIDANSGAFVENINLLRGELAAIVRNPRIEAVVIGGEDRVPYYYKMDRPRKMLIADDSTLVREFERQDGEIFALAIDPRGERLVVGGAAPTAQVYDLETGERTATISGHSAGIYTMAFDPTGAELATAGFDGSLRLYRAADGELLHEFVPVPIGGSVQGETTAGGAR